MQRDSNNINELLFRLLDNNISDSGFARLEAWLSSGKQAQYYYCRFMSDLGLMSLRKVTPIENDIQEDRESAKTGSVDVGSIADSNVSLRGLDIGQLKLDTDADQTDESELRQEMLAMLEMERTAPAIQIPKPVAQKPRLPMLDKSQIKSAGEHRLNKHLLVFALSMAASFLFLVGYLHFFVPTYVDRPVVATLDASVDAVWDDKLEMPDAYGNMVQSRYRLKRGFASIRFDKGTLVTVQGPAELSLNSADDMEMFNGKMYAIVPRQAQGFVVKAGGNKIVDMGTEFGVEIGDARDVQLHVTKGRTLLFAGLLEESGLPINVDAGAAKKVYNDGFVKDIPLENDRFVRKIDSERGSLWRTETEKILFAEYFDLIAHTAKTPLNTSPKWKFHHPVFVNYDGTLAKDLRVKPYPSLVNKFTPEINKVYTISLDVVNPTSGWIGLGFCREDLGNYLSYKKTFDQTGIGWMRYGNTTPAIAAYTGVDASSLEHISPTILDAGLKGPVAVRGAVHKEGSTTLMVKVDTTGTGEVFTVEYYQDGQKIAGPVAVPSKYFHHVGFSYKQTDVETEYTDGILLDNFIITVRE